MASAAPSIMLNVAQIGIIVGTQLRVDLVPGTGSLQVLMIALAHDRPAGRRRRHRARERRASGCASSRPRWAARCGCARPARRRRPSPTRSTSRSRRSRLMPPSRSDAWTSNDLDLASTALAKLTEECDRAAAVVRSIRDLVKQGTLVSHAESDWMTSLIEDLRVGACRRMRSAIGITHRVSTFPASFPRSDADGIQLEQAIDNLVDQQHRGDPRRGRGEPHQGSRPA